MPVPRQFLRPLVLGAPEPPSDIPTYPSRMIHFFDPSNERIRNRLPQLAPTVDILLGNLEDAIPPSAKEAARGGLIEIGQTLDLGATKLWTRVNAVDSPWFLDDMLELTAEIGGVLDTVMLPKVNGPEEIRFLDLLLAQLEARNGLSRPILIHAILETAQGVSDVEAIAQSSPRLQGMSLGPSDLAASRRMKTTRVGGPHPGYVVRTDADPDDETTPRTPYIQDPWHYTLARMIDACAANEIYPFYGPFGDFSDPVGCEDQFRAAFILGCVGAWTLHPNQIPIAKAVFRPNPDEVSFARRVVAAMEEAGGSGGVAVVDGKMQDDATYKQCQVLLDLADMLSAKDPELAELYAG